MFINRRFDFIICHAWQYKRRAAFPPTALNCEGQMSYSNIVVTTADPLLPPYRLTFILFTLGSPTTQEDDYPAQKWILLYLYRIQMYFPLKFYVLMLNSLSTVLIFGLQNMKISYVFIISKSPAWLIHIFCFVQLSVQSPRYSVYHYITWRKSAKPHLMKLESGNVLFSSLRKYLNKLSYFY